MIAEATRAGADRARGIVLSGAAGVGKTRVAREAVAGCGRRDARRHWIVGTASARSVPLGAFADIASDFGPDPLRRVREVIDGLIGDRQHGEVIVGVDDAHLLDDLSAFAVHQLVTRRLATVILTIRSGESPPDAITAIWKDHHLERLELQPLSLPEIAALVEHILDGPVDSFSAQRLWQYTQGNALYLRHLLENEVNAGRMTQRSGVWLWDGQPRLSPTLAELLEARIAQVPMSVRDVLDALAVAEPLETGVLEAVAGPDALAEAESLGLISVDPSVRPASARLAHPLLGEVRRPAPYSCGGYAGASPPNSPEKTQPIRETWCDERCSPWNPISHLTPESFSPRRRPPCSSVIYDLPKSSPSGPLPPEAVCRRRSSKRWRSPGRSAEPTRRPSSPNSPARRSARPVLRSPSCAR